MIQVDRTEIAAEWAARGFSCELWIDPPGQWWENYAHDTDEMVSVLDGDMEFQIDGEAHSPKTGEELLIPAGAVHSARNVGATTAHWLYGYRMC
jgi:quercetin dioxygenase-like cupin family protein